MSAVDDLFAALDAVEDEWKRADDRDEVVRLWLDVEYAGRSLSTLVRTIAGDAADRLADREDPTADFVTTTGDIVHLERGYAAERWSGRDLLDELAVPVADPNGEVILAVPVEVLVDVLPGCATSELTSSKWRTTGLTRHLGGGWRRYRSRDAAPLVIRRGEAVR